MTDMMFDDIEIEFDDIDDPPIENIVVGYDGNYVLIEDDDENQYRLFCGDRESMAGWFPIGSVVDEGSMAKAEPTIFERWIGWD